MEETMLKIEKVVSHHKIENTDTARLSNQFMDDILWLIEQEKNEFKKQMKAEIKYMLNGFSQQRS